MLPKLKNSNWRLLCLGASLNILAGSSLFAAPLLQPSQSSYSNLKPGDTFSLILSVENPSLSPDPTPLIYAYDFYVRSDVEEAFLVIGQSFTTPLSFGQNLESLPYQVTTTSTNDFGARSTDVSTGFGAGTSIAQTIAFQVASNAAPGEYFLSLGFLGTGPNLVDTEGNEYAMSNPILISISVVPEPSVTSAVLFGSLLLFLGVWRRYTPGHSEKRG